SSRRRHTRCYRDWSSDVCSSDLDAVRRIAALEQENEQLRGELRKLQAERFGRRSEKQSGSNRSNELEDPTDAKSKRPRGRQPGQIGRASCRERVTTAGRNGAENN